MDYRHFAIASGVGAVCRELAILRRMENEISPFVVVSNRVPRLPHEPSTGGLVAALRSALEDNGGLWLGWSGCLSNAPNPKTTYTRDDRFNSATTDLSAFVYRGDQDRWRRMMGHLTQYDVKHRYRTFTRSLRSARRIAPVAAATGDTSLPAWRLAEISSVNRLPLRAEKVVAVSPNFAEFWCRTLLLRPYRGRDSLAPMIRWRRFR